MRLIDADALKDEVMKIWAYIQCITGDDVMDAVMTNIKNAPTVDAVAVVRCADCKWFDISESSGTVEPIGYKCKRKRMFVESDDFCKYGEVREE